MPRSRGNREFGEYAPLRPGPPRRRPWLRTAQLNVRGWFALVGMCAVAAAVGLRLARGLDLSVWPGLALAGAFALLPVGGVILADRWRWASMETSFGWSGSIAEVTGIAQELRGRGVSVQVRPDPQYEQPWWDRIETPPHPEPTASLVYAGRHAAKVRAVLRAHGIDPPREW
jgi:hypothetical protein